MGKKKNRKNKANKNTPAVAAEASAGTANAKEPEEEVAPAVSDVDNENSKNAAVVSLAETEGDDDASQYDTAQEDDDEKDAAATKESAEICQDDDGGDAVQQDETTEKEEVEPPETTESAVEAVEQDDNEENVSEEEDVSDLSSHDDAASDSETEDDTPWVGTTPEGDIKLEGTDTAEEEIEMGEVEEVYDIKGDKEDSGAAAEQVTPQSSPTPHVEKGGDSTEAVGSTEDTQNSGDEPAPPAGESTSEVAKKEKSPLMEDESRTSSQVSYIGDIAVGADKEKADAMAQNIEATLGPLLPSEEAEERVVVDTADAPSIEGKDTTKATLGKEANDSVVADGDEEVTHSNSFNKLIKKIVARTCCLKSARNIMV